MTVYYLVFRSNHDYSCAFYHRLKDFVRSVVRLERVGMYIFYGGYSTVSNAELSRSPEDWTDKKLIAIRDSVADANVKKYFDFGGLERRLR